jgi:membrane protein
MADEPVSQLQKLQRQAQALIDDRSIAAAGAGRVPAFRRFLHFWVMVARSFTRNRLPVRASALAYSSLLAMIPMLALVLSVTTSILKAQGEKPIRAFVDRMVQTITPSTVVDDPADLADDPVRARAQAEAQQARDQAVHKINEFIDRAQTGTIGATGAIALLLVAISMLARIEETFNDIWGVARGRSWYMRVVLYWGAITLGPVALICALGLTTTAQLGRLTEAAGLGFIFNHPLVNGLIGHAFPIVMLSLAFAMVYLLLPNTRVQFSAAAAGGLTAGPLWHLNNQLSVVFVSRITSNNAIYGSLGVVPVFMIGMYLGWLILLFGAQVAYAYQNREAYLQERLAQGVNQLGREFAALRILAQLGRGFHRGDKPPGLNHIASLTGVPSRLAGQLLGALVQAGLVVETADRETGYAPARPLARITVHDVLTALRTTAGTELTTRDDPGRQLLRAELAAIRETERSVAAPITLEHLVERIEAAERAGEPPRTGA